MGRARRKERSGEGLRPILGSPGRAKVYPLPGSEPKMIPAGEDDVDYNLDAVSVHLVAPGILFVAVVQGESRIYQVIEHNERGTIIQPLGEAHLLVPGSFELLVSHGSMHMPSLTEQQIIRWGKARGVEGTVHQILGEMTQRGLYDHAFQDGTYLLAHWVVGKDSARAYATSDAAYESIKKRGLCLLHEGPVLEGMQTLLIREDAGE